MGAEFNCCDRQKQNTLLDFIAVPQLSLLTCSNPQSSGHTNTQALVNERRQREDRQSDVFLANRVAHNHLLLLNIDHRTLHVEHAISPLNPIFPMFVLSLSW